MPVPGCEAERWNKDGKVWLVKLGRCRACQKTSPAEAQGAEVGIRGSSTVSMSRAEVEKPEGEPNSLRAEQTLDLLLGVGIGSVRGPAWLSPTLDMGGLLPQGSTVTSQKPCLSQH